jgi:penicillin amidase
MLTSGRKFDADDFARLQQDTISLPARNFLRVLEKWRPAAGTEGAKMRTVLLNWDCNITMDSRVALIYEVWIEHLHHALLPKGVESVRLAPDVLLNEIESSPEKEGLLAKTLKTSLAEIRERLGSDQDEWKWGNLHKVHFEHPLRMASLELPEHSRPGDGYTVDATGGPNYSQTTGASYREVLDLSDWDRSIMTNVPGESGNPGDPHYGDLIDAWAAGQYHPLPFSRNAVEAAAEMKLTLLPAN